MAADVVAPPAIKHVAGGRGEVRQGNERGPDAGGVAGKTDVGGMVTQATPAAIEHRALAAPRRVEKMQVVEPGQRVKALDLAGLALLPVEPPEIDALLLHRVMQQFEIMLHKLAVAGPEGNRGASR